MSSLSSSAPFKHTNARVTRLQQRQDKRPLIYFVVPVGKASEQCQKNLQKIYLEAEHHNLNVMWLNRQIPTLEPQEGDVFVFDSFISSPCFDTLVDKLSSSLTPRFEILGPAALRQMRIDPQQNTVETNGSPIYTLAMTGIVICLLGFKDKAVKHELEQLVRWMNGSLSPTFTKDVSHVVTTTAYAPKCIEASKKAIPVMMEDWVKKVFEDNKDIPVSASDARYGKYLCPVQFVAPKMSTPAHSIIPDWSLTSCSTITDERTRVGSFKTSTEEPVSQLRATPENIGCLEGCNVYVVETETSDKLKRGLKKSGAVKMNRLSEDVTHVIVAGGSLPKRIEKKNFELGINDNILLNRPYVVTVEWVVQSAKDGSRADEDAFKPDANNNKPAATTRY